jgi:hypothetical protein
MSAPVGNTCPDIDAIKQTIKEAYANLEMLYEACEYALSDKNLKLLSDSMELIEPLFANRFNPLEDLRDDNYSLRQWGEKNEEKIMELEEEIKELSEQL